MRALHEAAHPGRPAGMLVVLLPPAHAEPEDFVAAGFAQAVRERALDVDLTFAALKFGHVTDRSVVERVIREHLEPARARGVPVWLGGISLGGYVALCCAAQEPQGMSGLCLFAPYLGSYLVTSEIQRTGLSQSSGGDQDAQDEERRLWQFLKTRTPHAPRIYLGLGREDRFGDRHRLLAAALDPGDVDTVPGAHDWPTWRRLWDNFLDARLTSRR